MTSVVNAVSGNNLEGFAYNTEEQENGVETPMVYKVKKGKYLERHLQYNYTYDKKGRISAKEILKWNQNNSRFEKQVLPQLQLHRQRSKRGICSMEQHFTS